MLFLDPTLPDRKLFCRMDCLKLMRICEKSQGVKTGQFTHTCACLLPPTPLLRPRRKNVGNM